MNILTFKFTSSIICQALCNYCFAPSHNKDILSDEYVDKKAIQLINEIVEETVDFVNYELIKMSGKTDFDTKEFILKDEE